MYKNPFSKDMAAGPLISPSDIFGHGLLVDLSHILFAVNLPKLRLDHCVCIPAISAVQSLVSRLLLLFIRRRIEPFLRGPGYCSSTGHIYSA